MNVLYVEDNRSDADLLKREFLRIAPHITLDWVTTYAEAVEKLRQCTPDRILYDVLLVDMFLPDQNGISLIVFLQEQNLPIAVVMITGLGNEESAVAALKAGASDYVVKRNDYLTRLPIILERALYLYQDKAARERAALKASEEYFRTLIENISDIILVLGVNGLIRYVSQSVERSSGYTPDEMIGKSIFEFVNPDNSSFILDTSTKTVPLQGTSIEMHMRHKDGSWRYLEGVGKSVVEKSGEVLVVTNFQDITERKRAEQKIAESETKYRSVVENSLVGVYIVQDNMYRFVNKRWCEIYGYTYEETVDKLGYKSLVFSEDKQKVEDSVQERLNSGKEYVQYEFRGVRKDGEVVTLEVLESLIAFNGRPAYAGTVIDVTREKMLESQLRQAQKMEAIGTLAGGVAHDFNNILTVLTGYGTLLQMGMDKENPLLVYVDQILSASQKAISLTKSLLAFSRQQSVVLNPVNINDIVRGTEKLLKRLLTEDIALKVLFAADEVTIMADTTQIDQVLFNLVTNARDAMPKGGTITIETKLVELDGEFVQTHELGRPGKYALLSISDTGVGMDETTKEHIFDPFFTTKEVGKGTGLGLSTVYGIIKQHHGCIDVFSEPNKETIFNIYIPTVEVAGKEEKSVLEPVERGKETILVAEDNQEVRSFVCDVLMEFGYAVIEAADGAKAIDAFNKYKSIDLLILDSVMPKKSGREVYDAINKIKPGIKVLFTSGHTRDVILDKGIEDKKFDFLSKPLLPLELLQKVREVLDRE